MRLYRALYLASYYLLAPASVVLLFLMLLTGYAQASPQALGPLAGLLGPGEAYKIHRLLPGPLWMLATGHAVIMLYPRARRLGRLAGPLLAAAWILGNAPVAWLWLRLLAG